MYNAEVIAHSLSPQGKPLLSFVVTYPRIIHAEMCRHRMHSRNTASSRAIPFSKMVKEVIHNPFIPIAFQKAHKGMQGTEYLDINKEYSIEEIQENLHEFLMKAFKDGDEEESWDDDWKEIEHVLNEYVYPTIKKQGRNTLKGWWLTVRDFVVSGSVILSAFGVTKQLCNRLLEPFVWVTEIVSGTEWENFFELRCPQYELNDQYFRSKKDWSRERTRLELDWKYEYSQGRDFTIPNEPQNNIKWLQINKSPADIHIQIIAELMWDAMNESEPKQLKGGEWHIPFGDKFDEHRIAQIYPYDHFPYTNAKIRVATARCARVSYLNFEGKDDYEADIKLHDRLAKMKHWSPFEHCAKAMSDYEYDFHHRGVFIPNAAEETPEDIGMTTSEDVFGWCRNFNGFIQYRELIEK